MHDMYLLQDIFYKSVNNYPEKVAVIYRNNKVSYKNLYLDVISVVSYFESFNLNDRFRVSIQSENIYALIVLYWAMLTIGGTVTILPGHCDDKYLDNVLENLEPDLVILSSFENSNTVFPKSNSQSYIKIHFSELSFFKDYSCCIDNGLDFIRSKDIVSSDLAMIMYTSGSSGVSKGVMLSHDNMLSAVRSIQAYLQIDYSDVIYSILPMHFDYGLYQMLLSFNIGATLVIENGMVHPMMFLKTIKDHHVSILPILPNIVSMLMKLPKKYFSDNCCVKKITNTGERLNAFFLDYLKNTFQAAQVFLMYGLTECKRCSYIPPDVINPDPSMIGIPMPNLTMSILDDCQNVLPPFGVGEIVVSSSTVMQGYWMAPELTRKKIKVDKFGRKLLMTGDIGYKDDKGFFYLLGRSDHIVKLNGEKFDAKYYIGKIENLTFVIRVHLFIFKFDINQQSIVPCVEVSHETLDQSELILQIRSIFALNHKPLFCYLTNQFPNLTNGKIDIQKLEYNAKKSFRKYHGSCIQ